MHLQYFIHLKILSAKDAYVMGMSGALHTSPVRFSLEGAGHAPFSGLLALPLPGVPSPLPPDADTLLLQVSIQSVTLSGQPH